MKKFNIFIFIFFMSCSYSPLSTGKQAEINLIEMGDIKKGMSINKVKSILHSPFKAEKIRMDNKKYLVWFYITKEIQLGQRELIDENFTPFVFYKNKLQGWGYKFYNHVFNIDKIMEKRKKEERSKYTEDRDEWPSNEHKIITPKEESPIQKSVEEMIEK